MKNTTKSGGLAVSFYVLEGSINVAFLTVISRQELAFAEGGLYCYFKVQKCGCHFSIEYDLVIALVLVLLLGHPRNA